MRCGISTACFYPENTLEALRRVADLGAPVTEVFLNTFHELEDSFLAKLLDISKAYQMEIVSLHPFTSPMEGLLFATEYQGRLQDGIELYQRYYQACKLLGADKLVFHGSNNMVDYPADLYAKNLRALAKAGKAYGVTLCHENVYYCRMGSPENVRQLRPMLEPEAAYTLDLKQLRRKGASTKEMLDAMSGAIQLVHISDCDPRQDCIPPGLGEYDFTRLLRSLKQQGYRGDFVIELYRDGFDADDQLADAMRYIECLIQKTAAKPERDKT